MSDVIFDEEKNREREISRSNSSPAPRGIISFLIRKGILKSERAANVVLILLALILFLASLFFWL
jgi:hypothetical protein